MSKDTSEQIITNKTHILQVLLEQSILEEGIELRIKNKKQVFTTFMIDLPPVKAESNRPDNEPFLYLKKEQYLFLEPPVSAEGNAWLSGGEQIVLHFFSGINAFEANVPCEKIVATNGKQVVQAGFPQQLKVRRSRKCLRVKGMAGSKIKVIVAISKNPIEVPIIDMSVSGISFCVRYSHDPLPFGKKILLIISVFDRETLFLEGAICHYTLNPRCTPCNHKVKCDEEIGAQKAFYGVDFFSLNHAQDKRIKEIIFLMQRDYLLSEKRDLINFNKKLEREVKDKTSQLREKDLQLLEERLSQTDKIVSLGTMAAGVIHDISNPISVAIGDIHLLKRDVDDLLDFVNRVSSMTLPPKILSEIEKLKKNMDVPYITENLNKKVSRCGEAMGRIKEIVQTLKDFSRLDKGDEVVDIDIIKEIEMSIEMIPKRYRREIEIIKEFLPIPKIPSYGRQMGQVFLNIIVNAFQAMKGEGILKIKTSLDGDYICIKLCDNGPGIPEDRLKKVFDAFYTTKSEGEGTGLGLSMCASIIKKHNGEITVVNNPDKGVTFAIKLLKKRGKNF